MQTLVADLAVSMSEFKKNPAAVLRQAGGRPVAVLNHNKVGFYMVEPQTFHAMLHELALAQRVAEPATAEAAANDPTGAYRAVMAGFLSQAKVPVA